MITFFASAMALAMAGCSADGPETAAQYPLERFTLQVGANIYHANIDQEAGTVTVGQIKYGGQVTAVGCYLADGAQIYPNPQNFVGDWPERQEFTVTSGGKETVYTVILSAYEGKFPGAQGEIIFFDDFDQADGLDMNSWDYVPKGTAAWQVSMSGSPDQSYVKDGNLVLVVDRKDGVSLTGGVKTQGKIWFQGNFRVDVCARFVDDGPTVGQAIWMMPEPAYQVYQDELAGLRDDLCRGRRGRRVLRGAALRWQQAVDDLRIGFSGVQIPRCLHRQAQFFNIEVCSVRRVDFT